MGTVIVNFCRILRFPLGCVLNFAERYLFLTSKENLCFGFERRSFFEVLENLKFLRKYFSLPFSVNNVTVTLTIAIIQAQLFH